MTRVPVTSSNIRSVGFEANVLEVEFTSGQVYRYTNVPAEVHQALLAAPSIGAHFQQYIRKGGFACEKVTTTADGGILAPSLPSSAPLQLGVE